MIMTPFSSLSRPLKVYVVTTGIIFALITLAHIARAFAEGPHVVTDPFFVGVTVLAIALAIWALALVRRWPAA